MADKDKPGFGDVLKADQRSRSLPILQQGFGSPEADRLAEFMSTGQNPGSATPEQVDMAQMAMDSGSMSGGIKKTELPMDLAARMARAKEMGFDTGKTLYHGTNQNIKEFRPNSFFTDKPNFANEFTKGENQQIYPVHTNVKKTWDYEDPEHLALILDEIKPAIKERWEGILKLSAGNKSKEQQKKELNRYVKQTIDKYKYGHWENIEHPDVQEAIKKHGFDSYYVKEKGNKNLAVYNPENIRSTQATFDPKKSKSGNILAGAAGAGVAGSSLNGDDAEAYAEGGPVQGMDDSINVLNPENELVSIPKNQLQAATQAGYTQATPEDIHEFKIQSQYGEGLGPAKAAAISAAKSSTFGLSTKALTAAGMKPEDISGYEEANPVASAVGEVAGLFTPMGEGAALAKLGEAAIPRVLQGAGLISKVGSAAVKGAVETAAFQGGNELHKMFLGDPEQTVGTALTDIGLSGLLGAGVGGGIGAISPLWKETVGKKLGGFLEAVQKRANGESVSLAPEIESAITKSGVELAPEVRVALSDNPELINQWQKLQESTTSPGLKAQESLREFRKSASDNLVSSFGKSIDEIPLLTDISDSEAGQLIQKQVVKSVEEKLAPLTDQFESIKQQFSKVPFNNDVKSKLQQDLAEIAQKEGYLISAASPQNQVVQSAIKDLNNVKTLEDLRKLRSIIGTNTFDPLNTKGLNHTGSLIKKAFNDVEENLVESVAGARSPQLLEQVKGTRNSYKQGMDLLESLNDRLHVGNYGGARSFVNGIKDMKPEDVLRRLSSKSDAGLLDLLSKEFPEVSQAIKDHSINKLLSRASVKAPEGHAINSKTLFSALDKMSPEMRRYLLPPGAEEKLRATQTLLKALPERMNPSGTAKTLDSLWSKIPGSATALVTLLSGHGPVAAGASFILGQTAKWLGRDVPDAMRLGFLKFLGHSGPVDPAAFKTMVDFAVATVKGENLLSKGVKNLFKSGQIVGPTLQLPDSKARQRLDKKVQELTADNSKLLEIGGDANYYLPEHGGQIAATAVRAVQYLNGLRPSEDKPGVLDGPRVPSTAEKSRYENALNIAEAPLSILHNIKNGTVTLDNVMDLKSIHPGLYNRMSQKMITEVMEVTAKKELIPYKTRFGLSLFLGQPLDASMTQYAIQANQVANQPQMAPQQTMEAPRQTGSKQALSKLPQTFLTPNDARSIKKAT